MSIMNITKRCKCFLLLLLVTLGAIFLAPKVSALDNDAAVDYFNVGLTYLSNSYDTSITGDNYYVVGSIRIFDSDIFCEMAVVPKDETTSITLIDMGVNNAQANISFGTTTGYTISYYANDVERRTRVSTYSLQIGYNFTFLSDDPTIYTNYGNTINQSRANVQILDMSDTIPNVDFVNFDNMKISYLKEKGFNVSSAYFADEHGVGLYTLPIVTSYLDLPSSYDGMFLIDKSTEQYFRYQVGIMPTSNPNDFSEFWDKYVVVTFNTGTYTNADVLISNGFNVYPAVKIFGSTTYNLSVPYQLNDNTYLRGTLIPFQTGSTVNVGSRWRYDDESLAIPRTITSDLIIAFTYHNYVVNPDTQQTTDEGGSDSDEYNTFLTNYYNNLQKLLYSSLTGIYNGQNGLSGSFSKPDSLDITDPSYTGDYDLTYDGNFLYLFNKLMDLEFVTKMLLGVFSISIAIYIIFGSSY